MAHGHYDHGPTVVSEEELARASHADLEYLVNPPGNEYEHTDASVWTIVKFGLWLLISAVIVHVGLGLLYSLFIEQSKVTTEQPYPLASSTESRQPPAPRLQQFPRNEITDFRRTEEEKLNGYGWVNKDAGTVHIPVNEAMRLVLERHMLESRTPESTAPATPGLMPSDSSSGRVMERRRQ